MPDHRRSKLIQLLERLESRTLMHGDGDFHADVNFQPAGAPVPDGYLVDSGLKYGDRGGGYTYGWNSDNSINTRDRNSDLSADQRYDTLIHMQKNGSFKWEISVPNGSFSVHLVAGDPTAIDSNYRVNIENTLLINGKPTTAAHWLEGSANIDVTDGKLTISNASGSANNKLAYIDIESVVLAPPGVANTEMSTPDASASEKNLDPGKIRFTRDGSTATDLVVNYFLTGSATSGVDFDSLTSSITIPAGASSADLVINPINDTDLEPAENVIVQIRPGDGYAIGNSQSGIVTLVDNEASTTQQPYFGTPQRFSTTIQAEDFNQGPNGTAYKDKTAGNASGSQIYRFSDVDIAPTTDVNGGFAVTHLQSGEYLKYSIEVPVDGVYRIETRVASIIKSGSNFHISFDGKSTGNQQFINTGGLEKWTTLVKTATLTAGVHEMKYVVDTSKTGGEVGSLNYIRVYRDLTTTSGVKFNTVAALPFAREEGQSATLNGQFYVFGGLYVDQHYLATPRVDQYDPATNTWTRLNDMPEAFTHAAVVVVDGTTAWFIGAYVGNHPGPGTSHVWMYDGLTDTWTQGPDLPQPRGAGGGGPIERTIDDGNGGTTLVRELHFFGGRDMGRDTDEVDHWALDLAHPELGWQTRASLPSPRNHLSGAVVDGKLYAIAGQQLEESHSMNQTTVDVYDPATDTWSQVAGTPLPISHVHQSTLVLNGKIITIGGELVHNTAASEVLMYDPSLNLWSLIGYLPSARRAMMTGVIDGKLIATGGFLNGKQNTTTWVSNFNL